MSRPTAHAPGQPIPPRGALRMERLGSAHELRTLVSGDQVPSLELRHRPAGGASEPWPSAILAERELGWIHAAEVIRKRERVGWWTRGGPDQATVIGKGVPLIPPYSERPNRGPNRWSGRMIWHQFGEDVTARFEVRGLERCRELLFHLEGPAPSGEEGLVDERLEAGLFLEFEDGWQVRIMAEELWVGAPGAEHMPIHDVLDSLVDRWRRLTAPPRRPHGPSPEAEA
mgnify:FL=1